jgi:hypothetical protein
MHRTDAPALLGVRLESAKMEGRLFKAYPNLADVRWHFDRSKPTYATPTNHR